jgi:hypothetical protein
VHWFLSGAAGRIPGARISQGEKDMKLLKMLSLAVFAVAASACGSSSDSTPTPPPGFTQPAGTVAVSFSVDDTANKVFTAGQLQWKGSMIYDSTTRKVTKDSTWGGPWATLYDDGPWTAGGHEGPGSVAGDNKWGVTVFVTPPATATDTYEYGLINTLYEKNFGNGWIWTGSNGTFTVAAGSTAPTTAPGTSLAAFGTTDLQIVMNIANLAAGTWDTSTGVKVKGSAWAWSEQPMATTGTGVYTFTLSGVVGAGKPLSLSGLLKTGDKPEFIFVFNGKEYKDANKIGLTTGAVIATKASGSSTWVPGTPAVAGNGNPYITVP